VVTRYLPSQLEELTGRHMFINYGFYPSMITAAFLAPWLGRFAGARKFSIASTFILTVVCCFFTVGLGLTRSPLALIALFAIAQVCYQLALVPYNNLLPSVATPNRIGFVSGLGVGIGYAGVIISLPIAAMVIEKINGPDVPDTECGPAYIAAAILFLIFTLPMVFFVQEKTTVDREKKLSSKDIFSLLKDKACKRFVIGNFLCSDALNAILIMIVVYLKNHTGLEGGELTKLLIVLNVSAMVSGVLYGWITDRLGPKTTMPLAAFFLAASILLTHFIGGKTFTLWTIVLLGGPGVAGIWVAGRKWVILLAPTNDVGTLFGFYGLSNKLSLLNLTLFALLADWTGNYTWSVLVLIVSLTIGIGTLLSVPSAPYKNVRPE